MTPAAAAARQAVRTRNATEEAIIDAAKGALAELGIAGLTIDAVARRAFVSRTSVYFYFKNKQEIVDRVVGHVFSEIYLAAAPYLDGDGDPRRELHTALARAAEVVQREGRVLLLAAQHAGGGGEHVPEAWTPLIRRFTERAQARLERDQRRGLAPDDIPARLAAHALLAMVEQHLVRELVLGDGDPQESVRALAELWWRAAYGRPAGVVAAARVATRAAGR